MDAFKILIAQLATNLSEPTEEHSEIQNPKNKENAKKRKNKRKLTRLGIEPRTTCVMITMIVILLSRCDNHCFNVR